MKAKTINISLPPELLLFVRERVDGGLYSSVSEVVRDGLRLLRQSAQNGDEFDRVQVSRTLKGLDELAQTQELGDDLTVRELIDEGRE